VFVLMKLYNFCPSLIKKIIRSLLFSFQKIRYPGGVVGVTYGSVKFKIACNNRQDIRRAKIFPYHEGDFTKEIFQSIKKHSVLYDIGANIGTYVLLLSLKNPDMQVLAFEPVDHNYQSLMKNLKMNNIANVEVLKCAVGDRVGEVSFDKADDGGGSLFVSVKNDKLDTKVTTIDHLVFVEGMPPPTIVLIDIEGYEYKALKGMSKTLDEFKPDLYIEVHKDLLIKQNDSWEGLNSYLLKKGYKSELIRSPSKIHKQNHYRFMCGAEYE
jgi:FkbM family methyltransferase